MFGHIGLIEGVERKLLKKAKQREKLRKPPANPTSTSCTGETALYTSSDVKFKSKGWRLPHIVHRDNKWIIAPAKPPPLVQVKYRLAYDNYKTLGIPTPNKPQVVATTSSLGDTGCSSMIAGMDFAKSLRLSKKRPSTNRDVNVSSKQDHHRHHWSNHR